jgi:hypothetical protein
MSARDRQAEGYAVNNAFDCLLFILRGIGWMLVFILIVNSLNLFK